MASSIVCNLETVSEDKLAKVLEHFFCSIRKKNGEEYKRSGYIAVRSAIQRHLDSLERKINLKGEKFVRCNRVLDAYLKDKKMDGREETVLHKQLAMYSQRPLQRFQGLGTDPQQAAS